MQLPARDRGPGFYRALSGFEAPPLPRFHLDRMGAVWVVSFSAAVADEDVAPLVARLARSAEGVVLRMRDETRKGRALARVAAGSCPERIEVEHAGYRFEARPLDPIDPGAYPDSEPLREALRGEAGGRRVLNLFAFTCLNGVVARLAGARSVVNVDVARSHLERGRVNYAKNGLSIDARDFVAEDALRFCKKARPASWDVIVCDPPPLLRAGRGHVPCEERLEELLLAVRPLAAPGATIHFLMCTARLGATELERRVKAALPGARLSVRAAATEGLDPRELPATFKDAVILL